MWAALGKEALQPQAQASVKKTVSLQYTPEWQCPARVAQLGANVIFPPWDILPAFCYFTTKFLHGKHRAPATRKTGGFRPVL